MLIDAIRLLLFPALMAFAASSDLLTMTISNRLSLLLASSFFLLALITGMSFGIIGMHLAAGALVLAVCFGFFAMGWIGGGDAKLAAATALWFGFAAGDAAGAKTAAHASATTAMEQTRRGDESRKCVIPCNSTARLPPPARCLGIR